MGHSENLNVRSTIKPLPGLIIDLTSVRTYTRDLSQYYIFDGESFVAHNQVIGGSFSMTLVTWKTAFKKDIKEGDTYISGVFEQFKENRTVISRRLAQQRMDNMQPGSFAYDPYGNNIPGYTNGFGPTSQEVLIPAFIAAYTGKDPEKVGLSSFPATIKSIIPNWKISYDGLTKIPALKKYLRNFKIIHNYTSRYSIGGYTTNLLYHAEDFDGLNYIRDAQDNFIPEQQIGMISIMESFSPLIKFDMTWSNSLTSIIEIKRSRNLSLSFANNQLMELRTNEIAGNIGYKFMQVPIIIKTGGQQRKFQSDLQVRMQLSIRDNTTIMRKISENYNKLSAGGKLVTIGLSADYILSSKLNLRFYYDQIINKPAVSLSFPTSNTKVGISLKFQLSQ
jgi:cell surface protein SprA